MGDYEGNSIRGGIDWGKIKTLPKFQNDFDLEEDFGMGDYSPLINEILAEPFHPKLKLPTLDKYDGKSDPRSHLACETLYPTPFTRLQCSRARYATQCTETL